jgi:hypothetical protein
MVIFVVIAALLIVACFNDVFPSWLALTILIALTVGTYLYS